MGDDALSPGGSEPSANGPDLGGRHAQPGGQVPRPQALALAAGLALAVAVTAGVTTWAITRSGTTSAAAVLPSATITASGTATPSPSDSPSPSGSPSESPATDASTTPPSSTANYADAWIPMPQSRLDEMAQYAQARYGTYTSQLTPSMVVLHFTEGSAQGTISFFAQDIPQSGVYPGVCAHFVIDQAGVVYRLVPTTTMCRHTVGLNDQAIGIEIEQSTLGNSSAWADQQILDRPAQIEAVLATLKDLQRTYEIPTDRIIGHGMANDDPQFRDLTGATNDHTDMSYDAVMEVRRRLDALP
ncbi:MAG: N-acetylmuramoyl-L-alanine amidase [Phycicoccus sp.]|nr:N-acetylmuramoyl-L-alanine amidase [Phycicoccus sp.]